MSRLTEGDVTVSLETQQFGFKSSLGTFIAEVDAGLAGGVAELGEELAAVARSAAPIRTGNLVGAIYSRRVGGNQAVVGVDAGLAPYAAAQESGSMGGYEIGADGQFLYNPEMLFAAIGPVTHPGVQAQHFLRFSFEAGQAVGDSTIARSLP